jgi:hypothetical protein
MVHIRLVDLEPFLRGPIFVPVHTDPDFFQSVRVDEELRTIARESGADINPDFLYGSNVPAWMEEDKASND